MSGDASGGTPPAHRLRPPQTEGLSWPRGRDAHSRSAAERDRLRDYERLMGLAHLAAAPIASAAALVHLDIVASVQRGWFGLVLGLTAAFAVVYHFVLPRWWCSHAKVIFGLVVDTCLVTALVALTGYHMSVLVFLYYLIVVAGALLLETRALYGLCAAITLAYAAILPADPLMAGAAGAHAGHVAIFVVSVWLVGVAAAAAGEQIQVAERRLLTSLRTQYEIAEQNARLSAELAAELEASRALAASLQRQREETQRLADVVIRAQEEERRRVARELHDEANQTLAALMTTIDAADRPEGRVTRAHLTATLARLRRLAAAALEDLQRIATELRPPALDEFGLVPALNRHVRERTAGTGLDAAVDVEGPRRRLPLGTELALYRIVQEALANAQKYAKASSIRICLRFLPGSVRLDVSDDGVGFDVAATPMRVGLGLLGMRERAAIVGGTLEVDSRPGGGTRVSATIPAGGDEASGAEPPLAARAS